VAERALDRWLRPRYVFALLAVIVVAAVLFIPQGETGANTRQLTTYDTDPSGARGIYEVAHRLGWRVMRRRAAFEAPVDTAAVYLILDPPLEPSATEVGVLLDAVRRGANVVVIPSMGSALADSIGIAQAPLTALANPVVRPDSMADTLPAPEVRRAAEQFGAFNRTLAAVPATDADTNPSFPSDAVALVQVRQRREIVPTMMARRMGRGLVVVVADPDFLRNWQVRRGAAAVLAVRLIEWIDPDRAAPLVFDEYHQGYGAPDGLTHTVVRALVATPEGRGLLQLIAAGVVLWLAYAVRPIPPAPRRTIERRSPFEHVGALSRAYEQIDATRLATHRLVRGLRRRHSAGVAGGVDDAEYLARLAGRKPELAGDAALLRRALEAPLPAAEWVAVGGAIDHIERTITQ
jgi:hypothetical protein